MAEHTWSPQDLTKDNAGFVPIPDDDYLKLYQRSPELWPVEFFVVAYRRATNMRTQQRETQVLVRASANGTAKWGLGTGVPATRWMVSTQDARPPRGYKWAEDAAPTRDPSRVLRFAASNFPQFPRGEATWEYGKIDIREDAFDGPDAAAIRDSELMNYAERLRNGLRARLSEPPLDGTSRSCWDADVAAVVLGVLERPDSRAALEGTLRMSGLFARRLSPPAAGAEAEHAHAHAPRYVSLGEAAVDPAKLVRSMRVFTMFPQMPDPLPRPSTPPEELRAEITSRAARMAASGRDPHVDPHGRRYTHVSTSNVSNTIHGVYLVVDATALPGLEDVPAFDLFGTSPIRREWVSLQELKVLDADGAALSTEDTKPTFISGFIVRQLVKDGVIDLEG